MIKAEVGDMWEEVYRLKLDVARLMGRQEFTTSADAIAHEILLEREIMTLPKGTRKDRALAVFAKEATRSDAINRRLLEHRKE